ncbi:hypothetical protein [Streptomyces chiangmaiensis]|uniref:Uncharacterized protein n=1 Tax=Streptomyces chiangmaiensis TaxID=766497 RepID=A0ABU7FWM8_9ACTN|nr:hypothetical protein [Streptomyces chiangmaiensis]MED7828307.1 hypothetical protein [Streptomyces chiangmaiensis]
MSWDPQHGNRTYGASGPNGVYAGDGAYQDGGDTQGLQVIYDPYGGEAQAYDAYVDPAAAHGWHESAAPDHGVALGDGYSHPQGAYGDSHNTYRGGHDAHEGGGTHESDRGASGTEHEHMYRDDGYAYGADEDQNDAGHDDGSVFVDVSGRRSRLIRRAGLAVAAVCVVFMTAVIAGFFSSVPSGGPLPWGQDQKQDQKQDDSKTATDQPGSTAEPTADPSARSGKSSGESAAPSPSVSASKSGGETKEPTTTAPTTAAAPTTSAPGRGNSSTSPGRGQGSTKGPR